MEEHEIKPSSPRPEVSVLTIELSFLSIEAFRFVTILPCFVRDIQPLSHPFRRKILISTQPAEDLEGNFNIKNTFQTTPRNCFWFGEITLQKDLDKLEEEQQKLLRSWRG